jgi:signal transduction histidine kinase
LSIHSLKLLILSLLALCTVASGQKTGQAKVDSLLVELPKAKHDTVKLNILLNIMTTYNTFNREEGLKYVEEALAVAIRTKSTEGEADVKNVIGRMYWRNGLFEKALNIHNEAKKVFESIKDENKIALTIRYIGQDYGDAGNYEEALKHFLISLSIYKKLGDLQNMAYLYNLLDWVHGKQGNYVEASKYSYLTLDTYEEMGDKNGVALALADIAVNYINLGNYNDALKYFKKSGEVFRKKGDQINLGYNYNLLGWAYRLMGQFDEAIKNYDTAVVIGKTINDANVVANAYDGKAEVYKARRDYPQALTNYLSAAELFKKWSNKRELARVYCSIGEYYRIVKEYALSKKYYNDAYALTSELDSKSLVADYYHGVELLDSAMQDWRGAYFNHKNYIRNRDSIFNQENIKKMVQLQLNYDFEKRAAMAKAVQEGESRRQQNQMLFVSAITTLVFALAIVLYRNQQRQSKTNLELQKKSKNLEDENHEKTSILNIVSHDLKAPLDKIRGLSEIMMMSQNLSKQEKEEYLAHIAKSIDQGTSLIKKLLEAQSAYDQTSRPSRQQIDIVKFVQDFQFEVNGQLLKKRQNLKIQIDKSDINPSIDQEMLTRILDNLVSNASKFSENGRSIYLRVWCNEENLNLTVRDEGPGISSADQKNLFRKFQTLSSRPTEGESSTGLGLSIVKALVEKLDGSIQINSKVGVGTEFTISIPCIPVKPLNGS